MKKARRAGPAEQARELNLAAGGSEEVLAPHDQVDALVEVVDHHRELVGPVAVAIADQEIASLVGGHLLDRPQAKIAEGDGLALEANAARRLLRSIDRGLAAGSRVTKLAFERTGRGLDRLPRTGAGVDEARALDPGERVFVRLPAFALAHPGLIRPESEPLEILEDRLREFVPGSGAVVVFDAEEDAAAEGAGETPHRDGVRHVSQVQEPGGRGCEPRGEPSRRRLLEEGRGQRFTATPMTSNRAPKSRVPEPRKARAGNSLVKYVR